MKKKNITLAMLAILCSSGSFSASEEELDAREKKATKDMSSVIKVERSWGRFQVSRDEYFYGEQGSHTRSAAWLKSAFTWLENWDKGLLAFSIVDNTNVNTALSNLEKLITDQDNELRKIESNYLDLRRRIDLGTEFLDRADTLDANSLVDYKHIIAAVTESKKVLRNSFQSLKVDSTGKLEELRQIRDVSTQALRAKLRSELIKVGIANLETVLAKYDDLVVYENEVLTLLSELSKTEIGLDGDVLNFRYFSAKNAYTKGVEQCQNMPSAIDAINVSNNRKEHAQNMLSTTCAAIDTHWQTINNLGLTPTQLAYEYGQVVAATAANECKTKTPSINCEKLAVLQSITLEQLDSMNEAEQAFYETSWSALSHGSIQNNIGDAQ